ncbi:MFS general substrate transporter [Martensiomyces pterosporus]|nr:MFS general substrate transporter [Martensiomyces pterosporus]
MTSRSQRHWLRTVSMLGACLSTTTAGTVYLFSTYGPALSQRLHLTSTQSNVVAISANYGLLLSGPLFGWAADTAGPRVLSVFAAATSCAAFSALAYTYSGAVALPHWLVLAGYMVLVGLAAQAANMAAVTTTTKNFKQNRGSAVSLCIAFFGLSPFVLSHINTLFFAVGDTPDTFGYLKFLSYLGLGASAFAALSLSVVGFGPSRHRRGIPEGFVVGTAGGDAASSSIDYASESISDAEEQGLLIHAHSSMPKDNGAAGYSAIAPGLDVESSAAEMGASEAGPNEPQSGAANSTDTIPAGTGTTGSSTQPGVRQPSNPDGLDYDTARDLGGLAYIADPEAQLLALVLFLCAGIGVFYNNNVGTIVNALYYSSVDNPEPSTAQRLINHHVATVSLGSFIGRLGIGIVADACKRMWNLPRSGILVVVVFSMAVSQVILGSAETLTMLWVGSAWTGLSYGLIFGFVPTLVSVWFGTRHFGSNWGLTSACIGFSGQGLGAFFGYIYDSNLPDQDPSKCAKGGCYRDAFILSTSVGLLGLLFAIILARRRGDRRRENRRLWEAQEVNDIEYVPFILAE